MNYKHSLAALVVASAVSGQALAYTAGEVTAIEALAPDLTWTLANWATALDGTTALGGTAWNATTNPDPCDWAGVACTGTDITHIEVPNAAMTESIADVLAALDPAKTTLVSLNLSNTVGPNNTFATGSMAALSGFTTLTHLALNATGVTGEVPDLAGAAGIEFVNIEENAGVTGFAGALGGASLKELFIKNTATVMIAGDLTSTLAASANSLVILDIQNSGIMGEIPSYAANTALTRFQANGTGLYGAFMVESSVDTTTTPANWQINGTGVVPDAATETKLGAAYDSATTLNAPSAVTAIQNTAQDGLDLTWTAAATGATATAYNVAYKLSSATAWIESSEAGLVKAVSGLSAGSYDVRVSSSDGTAARSSYTTASATIDEPTTPGPTTKECPDGTTIPVADTCPETPAKKSSGGGGAALYLALLPLMGLLRRKRA